VVQELGTFDVEWINNVVIEEFKILVSQPVLNVALAASEEVIDDSDFVSLEHQLVNEVRANKTSTTSDLRSQYKKVKLGYIIVRSKA